MAWIRGEVSDSESGSCRTFSLVTRDACQTSQGSLLWRIRTWYPFCALFDAACWLIVFNTKMFQRVPVSRKKYPTMHQQTVLLLQLKTTPHRYLHRQLFFWFPSNARLFSACFNHSQRSQKVIWDAVLSFTETQCAKHVVIWISGRSHQNNITFFYQSCRATENEGNTLWQDSLIRKLAQILPDWIGYFLSESCYCTYIKRLFIAK